MITTNESSIVSRFSAEDAYDIAGALVGSTTETPSLRVTNGMLPDGNAVTVIIGADDEAIVISSRPLNTPAATQFS